MSAPAGLPMTLISTREGTFIGEILARLITDAGRWDSCAWVREPPVDPTAAAQAVVDALAMRYPIEPRLRELTLDSAIDACSSGAVLVVELTKRCPAGLARILAGVRDHADRAGVSVVIATGTTVPRQLARECTAAVPVDTVEIAATEARDAGLDEYVVERIQHVMHGRTAALHDLAALRERSAEAIEVAAASAHTARAFLRRITDLLLHDCTADQREALEVALRTGYWHPQFSGGSVGTDELRPWVVPLEHDWGWVRPIWRRPLSELLAKPHAIPAEHSQLRAPVNVVWQPVFEARMLGPFEIRLDSRPIPGLTSQLGTSLLRYLLLRPGRTCPRDALIDTFWPDVDPDRARNRLQVAFSSLRKTLRATSDIDVVEFADGNYRLNPRLDVTIDVVDFERQAGLGQRLTSLGDIEAALIADRAAAHLYRGDLCADLPYEEWTVFPRERMRMMYGDVLDRLADHQWRTMDHQGCITTAQLILEQDPCREDAHRLLMRCYAAQGRTHQALRQFDSCRRVLKATLAANPARDTVATYLDIRDQGDVSSP
ncbi:MAG: winged helix-turn-helix domain-containing protein [Acidimicrobiia bacterium]|nr:winged helix-turn-helix domain-containing protein [Acidimicrobiia bacterium]